MWCYFYLPFTETLGETGLISNSPFKNLSSEDNKRGKD